MAKVNVSTRLNSSNDGITSFSGLGILKDKQLVFYEDDIKVVIDIGNEAIFLKRVHEQYEISLQFENSLTKNGNYDIKGDSIHIPIKTITNVLLISDGKIHIEYELILGGVEQGNFVYDVSYEVIQ